MATSKTKLIRNLTRYTLRLRFGSKKEPYHVELQARGQRGDVASIPTALQQHQTFADNVDRTFETITPTVAKKVAEEYPDTRDRRPSIYDDMTVTVERDSETERTVATYEQVTIAGKETLRRSRSENFEPERAQVPGSQDHEGTQIPKTPGRRNSAENESTDLPPFKGVTERIKS